MKLKNLKLTNFRNYESFEYDFKSNKTLIIGKNAQGKTNILEAIYYLCALDSVRIRKDLELITFNKDFSNIKANIEKLGIDIELEVILNPPKNKLLKVNGLKKTKSKDFLRVLSCVNFSVNDLLLLRGEPANRRKWLDLAIFQVYPLHSEYISKYNKIRLQKANFLQNPSGTNINMNMLDVYNAQLASSATNVIYLRQKYLTELKKIAKEKHLYMAQGENLEVKYNTIVEDMIEPKELNQILLDKLEEKKEEEIRKMQCLVGPHRDDVDFFINEINSKQFASQGQQRTIVLALKLAELDIIKKTTGEAPLLLLDDVLAELDNIRQNYLLSAIDNDIQMIITSVDTLAFDKDFLCNVDILKISDGKIAG